MEFSTEINIVCQESIKFGADLILFSVGELERKHEPRIKMRRRFRTLYGFGFVVVAYRRISAVLWSLDWLHSMYMHNITIHCCSKTALNKINKVCCTYHIFRRLWLQPVTRPFLFEHTHTQSTAIANIFSQFVLYFCRRARHWNTTNLSQTACPAWRSRWHCPSNGRTGPHALTGRQSTDPARRFEWDHSAMKCPTAQRNQTWNINTRHKKYSRNDFRNYSLLYKYCDWFLCRSGLVNTL